MPIGRRSQSEFSANRVLHQAPTAWTHYGPIRQFSASTANRPIGQTAEGIRKLNMMMRIQSGSLCRSGNRAFTANRPIRQFFPIRKSGICVEMGSNRAIGCFLPIGLLQPIGQLFLNRAGCPNRAIATIGNWMPLVQSVPIGSQSGRWSQSGAKTSC